jgi:hypothetical protein
MKQGTIFWVIAFVLTCALAVFQRMTGPTYPHSGQAAIDGASITYTLPRSHAGESNCPIEVAVPAENFLGVLEWKRHNTDDDWRQIPMVFHDGKLRGELPLQPIAGKLDYRVVLGGPSGKTFLPKERPLVMRFRGEVPAWLMIPHILAMFIAMLFSTRAGLEYFSKEPNLKSLVPWTVAMLFLGGLVLGPLVQKYAFTTWWSGWPLGKDLTDNKTMIALIGWLFAWFALWKGRSGKVWALAAALLLILVYLIPHSVLGSEFDYREAESKKVVSLHAPLESRPLQE